MKSVVMGISVLFLCMSGFNGAYAHCQIPCGIYDDPARFAMLREHVQTIEKSMQEIMHLSQEQPYNFNQLIRWVDNKEQHAQYIQDIVYEYFMSQRLVPVQSTDRKGFRIYSRKLSTLHQIAVVAMKTKQTTDMAYIQELRSLIDQFEALYFPKQTRRPVQ